MGKKEMRARENQKRRKQHLAHRAALAQQRNRNSSSSNSSRSRSDTDAAVKAERDG